MARSYVIYLVTSDGDPYAAFTVKHELKTWLSRQPPGLRDSFSVYRLRDNPRNHLSGEAQVREVKDWETEL